MPLIRRSLNLVVTLAALGVGILACSSAALDPSSSPASARVMATRATLIGSWTFVRACGGLAGQCTTTTNEPARYVFRSDDSVEAFRGGQRIYVLRFALAPGAADSSAGDIRPSLLIGAGPTVDPRPLRVSFVGDTVLKLDEGCCDRFAFEYRREP